MRCATYGGETLLEEMRYTWEGRNLTRWRYKELSTTLFDIKFAYDSNGLRVKKTVGTVEHRYVYDGGNLIDETYGSNTLRFLYDERGLLMSFILTTASGTSRYDYVRDILLNIIGLVDETGNLVVRYTYDAWGNILSTTGSLASTIGAINPFRYKGYYFDAETLLFWVPSRYYDPKWGRFISPADISGLNPQSINGLNLYSYVDNDPINISYENSSLPNSISGGYSSYGRITSTRKGNTTASGFARSLVGAIPDLLLGARYLRASGIHSSFSYATNTRYMFPKMGGTWRWFGQSGSSLSNFGTLTQATFKQILTGDARAGAGAIVRSIGGVVVLNFGVNALFNLYENGWDFTDVDMWIDTAIDTAIGVSSFYLAAGTMSLVTASVVAAGFAMPGIVVIGGVVLLSIGFEWLIRELIDYHD